MSRLPSAYTEHADAGEALFVERALTYVETETYNTLFPPLEGLKYVPLDTSTPPGAKFTTYKQYTRTGVARLISERGQDIPNVNVFLKEYTHQFYRIGAAYQYTLDDLLAAQMSASTGNGQLNIDMELALAAREAIDRGLDAIAGIGSTTSSTIPGLDDTIGADVGLLGLLNQTNASTYTPANGAGGSALWSTKTPDEKIADLTGLLASMESSTYKVFVPDTFLLPITQYRNATVRMGDGSDESTISLFKKLNPGVTVESWQYCEAAGDSGDDRCVAFINNKRYVRLMVSEMFRQLPPQFRDMEFRVNCVAKTAGVISPYPVSICYMDGI